MADGKILVEIKKDEQKEEYHLVFPEEDDHGKACFMLARCALAFKENLEKYDAERDVGHLLSLFIGGSSKRLMDVRINRGPKIKGGDKKDGGREEYIILSDQNPEPPADEETILLRMQTESIQFVVPTEQG